MGNGAQDMAWLLLVWGGSFAVWLVIQAIVCWLLMNCFTAVPSEHRKMEPGRVWLLMIPLFNLVWNFFVYPGLADSYRATFDKRPDANVAGDCGRTLGLALSVCSAVSVIPCIGMFTGLAALVLLIIYLVKAHDLRRRVLDSAP